MRNKKHTKITLELEEMKKHHKALELIKEYEEQYPGDKGVISFYAHCRMSEFVIDVFSNRNGKRIVITYPDGFVDSWAWKYF